MAYNQSENPFHKNKRLKKAEAELDRQKQIFGSQPTDNPYADMTNPYTDMTIDQRGADLQNQQFQQNQADILESTKEVFGSSGAASLAQTLSEENKRATQESSAKVGEQERQNQKKETEYQAYIDFKKADGEKYSMETNLNKNATLLGISQQEVTANREMIAEAEKAKWQAISDGTEAVRNVLGQV